MERSKYSYTLEDFRGLLRYAADEGLFYWTEATALSHAKLSLTTGKPAGSLTNGYREISFGTGKARRRYRVHKLVWLFETGEWPSEQLDHINGVRHDNRFCNLREITQAGNVQNVANIGRGVTGLLGVTYTPYKHEGGKLIIPKRKYRAEIRVNGIRYRLGNYETAELAHTAYLIAKRKYHPYSARIDIPEDLVPPDKYMVPWRNGGLLDFLCGHCGVTAPELFYVDHSRATCRKCLSKKQMARKPKKFVKPKYVCMHCGNDDKTNFYKSYQTACKPCVRSRTKGRRDIARGNAHGN